MNIELSTRISFKSGCKGWSDYVKWIDLNNISQVKTIDSHLNPYVDNCGSWDVPLDKLTEALSELPKPKNDLEYYQLKTILEKGDEAPRFKDFTFLGVDLSDETHTSSILNCGAWKGDLVKYKFYINEFGLLPLSIASEIQEILPKEWNDDPHSYVDMWAIYQKC